MGRNRLHWFQQFRKVSECDLQQGKFSWFEGGKLNAACKCTEKLNNKQWGEYICIFCDFLLTSDNCVDRHVKVDPDKIALIWEKDEPDQQEKITYK